MAYSYPGWQSDYYAPEEETREDQISEFMGDLLSGCKNTTELAESLGVSVSTIYRVQRTGKASKKTLDAMYDYWREIAE